MVLKNNNAFVVRFEDLIGTKAGETMKSKEIPLKAILVFSGISKQDNEIDEIQLSLLEERIPFEKGKLTLKE
ncbi:MAG: hypothetical protein IPJ20_23845 [Flammeovirgaceae bacterium]|nr:hypothetical protein [Flammeovirgaceae bacterium]